MHKSSKEITMGNRDVIPQYPNRQGERASLIRFLNCNPAVIIPSSEYPLLLQDGGDVVYLKAIVDGQISEPQAMLRKDGSIVAGDDAYKVDMILQEMKNATGDPEFPPATEERARRLQYLTGRAAVRILGSAYLHQLKDLGEIVYLIAIVNGVESEPGAIIQKTGHIISGIAKENIDKILKQMIIAYQGAV